MNKRNRLVTLVCSMCLLTNVGFITAASLDDVNRSHAKALTSAQQSQQTINALADKEAELLADYRQSSKLVEDLKVYNTKLNIQIDKQGQRLTQLNEAIADVQVIQRQMLPLIERMIDTLEQFVVLDLPFHQAERAQRIEFLRANLNRPDLSVAEKFRQVLEAYKIENEYGRKIDSYTHKLILNDIERDVTMLRVGRIALLYQTTDLSLTGMWDKTSQSYVALDNSDYQDAVRQATRIANKQANVNILQLPISAPLTQQESQQ